MKPTQQIGDFADVSFIHKINAAYGALWTNFHINSGLKKIIMKAYMLTSISEENGMRATISNNIEASYLIPYAIHILHLAGVIYQA